MKISVITPTADQPTGMRLAEHYMRRQTLQPSQWIVADDGTEPAVLTMGQTHIRRARVHEGGRSLAGNLLTALEHADGDIIVVWEHDDWYAPQHIKTCVARLANAGATGALQQRYYNVAHRCWIVMDNIGSALCNTAFLRAHKPAMQRAAQQAFHDGLYCVDRLFWDSLPAPAQDVHAIDTVVGIKGLPGRPGLGMGHRPTARWQRDPDGARLRRWIGADAKHYLHNAQERTDQ